MDPFQSVYEQIKLTKLRTLRIDKFKNFISDLFIFDSQTFLEARAQGFAFSLISLV